MERLDKRKPDELRPIIMKAGVIANANGSALVKIGKTQAIVAVYGPRELYPLHLQDPTKAVLRCRYTMVPFSSEERVRPGPSRRSVEISKVTREALESVLFLKEYPRTVIDIYIDILQADSGTRTAGINAASIALADAGIPMRDLVTAVAVGKIKGEYVMDLSGVEEEITECDLPVAYLPREKKFTLLQMDGDSSAKDVKALMKFAIKGCELLYKKQIEALKERWIK